MPVRCFRGISRESSSPRFVCSVRTDSGLEVFRRIFLFSPVSGSSRRESVGASLRLSAAKLDACFFKIKKLKNTFFCSAVSCILKLHSSLTVMFPAWFVCLALRNGACFFLRFVAPQTQHTRHLVTHVKWAQLSTGPGAVGGGLLSVHKAESFLVSPSSCHFKALYELSRDGRSAFFTLD